MTKRVRLREKLSRQPAALLTDWHFSLASPADRALYADPGDQASSDFEQDLAIQVRTRTIARLKRIEHTLILMQTEHYEKCRRCRKGDSLCSTGDSTVCALMRFLTCTHGW